MASRGFVNWSQPTVVRVEQNERPLRIAELVALAGLLGVDPADLVGAPIDPKRTAVYPLLVTYEAELEQAVRADEEAQGRLARARDDLAAAEAAAAQASQRRVSAALRHEAARARVMWQEG
jgi:hypothetical protein